MGKFTGIKCPKCGKKGLHYPAHAHARGWKEYGIITCRWCKASWKSESLSEYIEQQKLLIYNEQLDTLIC